MYFTLPGFSQRLVGVRKAHLIGLRDIEVRFGPKADIGDMKHRKLRLDTNALRSIDANVLHSEHGAFYGRMEFPLQGLITGPDFMKFRDVKRPADWPPQQILMHWRCMPLGNA